MECNAEDRHPDEGQNDAFRASELTFQPYGKNDTEVINSISRAELNMALMNAAEAQECKFCFQQRCMGSILAPEHQVPR